MIDAKILQLYAVTDSQWLKEGETLAEAVEKSIKGGVTLVQLREKKLDNEAFIALAKEVKKVTDAYNVPLLINDNIDVCLAIDAAGVHVGQEDLEAGRVRELLGPDKIIGVTAKSPAQALAAQAAGADYLGSGAMFGSSTKSEAAPMTMAQFAEIRKSVDMPIVLIGGIDASNIRALAGSGAQGAAVVSGIFAKEDIEAAAAELLTLSKEIFPQD